MLTNRSATTLRLLSAVALAVCAALALPAVSSAGTRGIACSTIKVQTQRHQSLETWKVYRLRGSCATARRVMSAYQAAINRTRSAGNCESSNCANASAPTGYACIPATLAQERRLGFVASCHGRGTVYRTYEDSHYAGV